MATTSLKLFCDRPDIAWKGAMTEDTETHNLTNLIIDFLYRNLLYNGYNIQPISSLKWQLSQVSSGDKTNLKYLVADDNVSKFILLSFILPLRRRIIVSQVIVVKW